MATEQQPEPGGRGTAALWATVILAVAGALVVFALPGPTIVTGMAFPSMSTT